MKSDRSQKVVRTKVNPGDLIVCNWSSYVEIIYLSYLYNPLFILPSPESIKSSSAGTEFIVRGFESRGALNLISSSGAPPIYDSSRTVKTLAGWISESKRLMKPLVVFPEGTTSNNRALLRCPKLNSGSVGEHNGKVRLFCLAFKHEPPSTFKNSITVPIPSKPMNLLNFLKANLIPILIPFIFPPRSVLIRYPRTDFIQLDSSLELLNAFDLSFQAISQVSKLKLTSRISGVDKVGFLKYFKSRSS